MSTNNNNDSGNLTTVATTTTGWYLSYCHCSFLWWGYIFILLDCPEVLPSDALQKPYHFLPSQTACPAHFWLFMQKPIGGHPASSTSSSPSSSPSQPLAWPN